MFSFRKIEDKSYWFIRCFDILKKFERNDIKISSVQKVSSGHILLGLNDNTSYLVMDHVPKRVIEFDVKNKPTLTDDIVSKLKEIKDLRNQDNDEDINMINNINSYSQFHLMSGRIKSATSPSATTPTSTNLKFKKKVLKSLKNLFGKENETSEKDDVGVFKTLISENLVRLPFPELLFVVSKNSILNAFFLETIDRTLNYSSNNNVVANPRKTIHFFILESNGFLSSWTYNEEYFQWIHCQTEHIGMEICNGMIVNFMENNRNDAKLIVVRRNGEVVGRTLKRVKKLERVLNSFASSSNTSSGLSQSPSVISSNSANVTASSNNSLGLGSNDGSNNNPVVSVDTLILDDRADILRFCRLFEPVLMMRSSKDGMWMLTLNNLIHITLKNYQSGNSNKKIFPISQYITSSIFLMNKFVPKKNSSSNFDASPFLKSFRYITYCIHPISKEFVIYGVDGILRIVQISKNNKTVMITKPLNKIPIFISSSKINRISSAENLSSLSRKFDGKRDNKKLNNTKLKFVEMFFVYNNLLCLTDHYKCCVYEPKSSTLIYQTLLPNEIIIENQKLKKGKESSRDFISLFLKKQKASIIWSIYFNETQVGIFSNYNLYIFHKPNNNQLLNHTLKYMKEKRPRRKLNKEDLLILSELSKEWNLMDNHKLFLLELILMENKRSSFVNEEKKENKRNVGCGGDEKGVSNLSSNNIIQKKLKNRKILHYLTKNLENPSLVWTSSSSLAEQSSIMNSVQQFLSSFPESNHPFWKKKSFVSVRQNEGPKKEKITKENKKESSDKVDEMERIEKFKKNENKIRKSVNVFESLTPLNLSIAKNLHKSFELAKIQLKEFQNFDSVEEQKILEKKKLENRDGEKEEIDDEDEELKLINKKDLEDIDFDDLSDIEFLLIFESYQDDPIIQKMIKFISERFGMHEFLFRDWHRIIKYYNINNNENLKIEKVEDIFEFEKRVIDYLGEAEKENMEIEICGSFLDEDESLFEEKEFKKDILIHSIDLFSSNNNTSPTEIKKKDKDEEIEEGKEFSVKNNKLILSYSRKSGNHLINVMNQEKEKVKIQNTFYFDIIVKYFFRRDPRKLIFMVMMMVNVMKKNLQDMVEESKNSTLNVSKYEIFRMNFKLKKDYRVDYALRILNILSSEIYDKNSNNTRFRKNLKMNQVMAILQLLIWKNENFKSTKLLLQYEMIPILRDLIIEKKILRRKFDIIPFIYEVIPYCCNRKIKNEWNLMLWGVLDAVIPKEFNVLILLDEIKKNLEGDEVVENVINYENEGNHNLKTIIPILRKFV